jgi:MscS family membrane protein
MRVKFETLYGGGMLFLVCLLAWSIWTSAQAATNQTPPAPGTNHPSAFVRDVEHLDQHYLTFWLDRVDFLRDRTLFGEPLWKYPASVIYVLLVFYASKLIDLAACVWLKKLAARTETKLDDLLLELLHGPIKIVAFAVFLIIGLNMFDWPEKVRAWFSKGLIVVVAASLTYLALKIIDLLLVLWRGHAAHEADRRFNEQLLSIVGKSLKAFTVLVAILVTAQNMQVNITAALASLSIGGLAVGLAAQDTLANLFGAIAVYMDKPFRVGDQIKLDSTEGTVEWVGMRSTRVRNPDGHLVAIPNKTVGNAIIINITSRPNIKTSMNLVLARTLPSEKVKRALALLDEIYRGNSMTQDVWVSFNQFAGGNINVMIVHWWKGTDYQKYLAGMQEMNLAVKDRFDAEGIGFA